MPEWLSSLLNTLATSVSITAGAVWLLRALFQQLLRRDIENFKATLQLDHNIQLEKLKSDLGRIAFETQTRFTSLHHKRAELLAEFYKRLVQTERIYQTFVTRAAPNAEPISDGESKDTLRLAGLMWEFFEENRIYFDASLADAIFALYQEFNAVWANAMFAQVSDGLNQDQKLNAWTRSWASVSRKVPELRRDIETAFRAMLGSGSAA